MYLTVTRPTNIYEGLQLSQQTVGSDTFRRQDFFVFCLQIEHVCTHAMLGHPYKFDPWCYTSGERTRIKPLYLNASTEVGLRAWNDVEYVRNVRNVILPLWCFVFFSTFEDICTTFLCPSLKCNTSIKPRKFILVC